MSPVHCRLKLVCVVVVAMVAVKAKLVGRLVGVGGDRIYPVPCCLVGDGKRWRCGWARE